MDSDQHTRELRVLHTISTIVEQRVDLSSVVHPILATLDEHLGYRYATATIVNKDRDDILIEAAHGLTEEQTQLGHYKVGEGVTGTVVKTGKPMVVPRISASPLFLNRTKRDQLSDSAFICVPIKEKQDIVGTLSVHRAPADSAQLASDVAVLEIVASMMSRALLLRHEMLTRQASLEVENRLLRAELTRHYHPDNIVGNSREMQEVYDQISQVAKSHATVLIHGDTGTGKELVANAIHYASNRADKPFVRVHCSALPESIIESELFGHVKGAFTGAVSDRKGRFELADGGTILLDEIGEIPLIIQSKLLRVLQEREFERVGDVKTKKVNVRIIVATHRDLPAMVERGQFREDLYYRLSVFPIFVPPLVKRKTDILLLANHFMQKYAGLNEKRANCFSNEALDLLLRHRWPGNVRELENCIERAVLLTDDEIICPDVLPVSIQAPAAPERFSPDAGTRQDIGKQSLRELVGEYEKKILTEALSACGNNINATARLLSSTDRKSVV